MDSLIADFQLDDVIGLGIGFFLVVVIPLVSMLLYHQRKMAEFLHRKAQPDQQGQIDRLESEVRQLKERINTLILLTEDRGALQQRVAPPQAPEQLR